MWNPFFFLMVLFVTALMISSIGIFYHIYWLHKEKNSPPLSAILRGAWIALQFPLLILGIMFQFSLFENIDSIVYWIVFIPTLDFLLGLLALYLKENKGWMLVVHQILLLAIAVIYIGLFLLAIFYSVTY